METSTNFSPSPDFHSSMTGAWLGQVSAIVAKADGNLYNEQGMRLGNAEEIGTGDEDLLQAAALEEFAGTKRSSAPPLHL